ncbi:hypothetical protein NMY22_g4730 [Coprinellus aureogranulatus]|nr:hypothetical protein NMY22_g4730 [Coprinellus aureogranulatus]
MTDHDRPSNVWANNRNTYENSEHHQEFHHHGDVHKNTSFNTNIYHGQEDKLQRAQEKLETKISRGAAHDSAERGPHAPKCDEGTREAVQDDMLSWIERGIERLLWLTGPAGTGKSAIAGSVADKCHDESRKWLAASFFFSDFAGQPDRYSKECLFPTLAYHLIQLNIPGLREEVLSAIDTFPSVFDKRLDDQLRILILEPLRNVDQAVIKSSTFKTIIIDGVDECKEDRRKTDDTERGPQEAGNAERDRRMSKEENHREIISTLVRASNDPSFPFRIIIASRPERAIERSFSSLPSGELKRIFLDDKFNPAADIELFLRARFDTIGRDHGLPDQWYLKALPTNWPGFRTQDVPRYLAEEASGQFIYAGTVIRYIQDGKDTPHEQLKRVLNWKGVKTSSSRPFTLLDALYTGILKGSPDPLLSVKWIRSLDGIMFENQLQWYAKAILEASPGQTEVVLGRLTALVGLNNDHGKPVFTIYHKSLADFLEDKERSGDLHLEKKEVELFLDERHYQVLKNRGPQGFLPPDLQQFYRTFCETLPVWIERNRQYNAGDVDWYVSLHGPVELLQVDSLYNLSKIFRTIHDGCSWVRCRPSCRIWRERILRYLKDVGYPVPTPLQLLQSRFPAWRHKAQIHVDHGTVKAEGAQQQPSEECETVDMLPPSRISTPRPVLLASDSDEGEVTMAEGAHRQPSEEHETGMLPPSRTSTPRPVASGSDSDEGEVAMAERNLFCGTSLSVMDIDNGSGLFINRVNLAKKPGSFFGGDKVGNIQRALAKLESKTAKGAAHDSAERGPDAPKCDEGTREAVQDDVLSWIDCGEETLLWLSGPAGSGKSAIAASVADKCREPSRERLAGSFIVSGFAGRLDHALKDYIFPTLAHQLIYLGIPGLREEILLAISTCPSVFSKCLDEQLRILILEPLQKVDEAAIRTSTFKAIIVDGIDKHRADSGIVDNTEQDLCEIHLSSLPGSPIKRIFLDDKYNPTADIELFLRTRLDKIGLHFGLPEQWYHQVSTHDIPHYLAQEANGQFIYAANVIQYIQDGAKGPEEQLRHLLNWPSIDGPNPFAALDELYTQVLRSTPDPSLCSMWLLAVHRLSSQMSSWYVKALLESSPGEAEVILGRLVSLVGITDENGEYPRRSRELCLADNKVLRFLQDRHCQTLKNRGPQGSVPPGRFREFCRDFSSTLHCYIDYNSLQYDLQDVDWWSTEVHTAWVHLATSPYIITSMFASVHQHCPWCHCLPACKIWRKGIRRCCKENGWRVPNFVDLFLDMWGWIPFDNHPGPGFDKATRELAVGRPNPRGPGMPSVLLASHSKPSVSLSGFSPVSHREGVPPLRLGPVSHPASVAHFLTVIDFMSPARQLTRESRLNRWTAQDLAIIVIDFLLATTPGMPGRTSD